MGIKLNAGDYVVGGFDDADAKSHLLEIASWGLVDWIEISGGDYENPGKLNSIYFQIYTEGYRADFIANSNNSTRQAFFAKFSKTAMELYSSNQSSSSSRRCPLVMLTGGLRTRAQFAIAIQNGDAQLIGIARHAILQPDLPRLLESLVTADSKHDEYAKVNDKLELCEGASLPEPQSPAWWPRLVGAGVGMAWYTVGMRRISDGEPLPIGRWWGADPFGDVLRGVWR